jgi:hypothetical protein
MERKIMAPLFFRQEVHSAILTLRPIDDRKGDPDEII